MMLVPILVSALAGEPTIPRACLPPHDGYPFCDHTLPLDKRLDDLIGRLTLQEKPLLLVGRESPKGNISRLGIPEYDWGGNCIHGVQSRCSPDGRCPTSFPNPNTLGASFNRTVWRGMGSVIGVELRSLWLQGVGENHASDLPHMGLDCWSPNVGIQRDPRWGRNLETPSEDPLLCGAFGAEYTLGLQNGSDPRYLQGVSTLKHFDANSLEGKWYPNGSPGGPLTRHTVDANISQYDLHSSYLPAFKASVMEGGAAGVMCSYNSINGVPSCANDWLLGDILRKDWSFRGYVSSDSGAVVDIFSSHHYTSNWTSTVAVAVNAGCDVESAPWACCPWATGGPYIEYIPSAVAEGLLKEAAVDAALRNALGIRFRLGLFDPIDGQPYWNVPPTVVESPEHVAQAMDATAQGFVLLENRGNFLPITPDKKTIAVVGPHATDSTVMLGNYLGQICPDSNPHCVMPFFDAINATVVAHGGSANFSHGCTVDGNSTAGFADAIALAKAADYVIYIGGLDGSLEGEGHDRVDVGLPQVQVQLLKELVAANSNMVVTLMHGGMVGVEEVSGSVAALVSLGYPGRYAAASLAATLFGETDHAWGKTTVTWYSSDITSALDMVNFDMATAPGRTYRYYTGKPNYPFGYGKTYTTFEVTTDVSTVSVSAGFSQNVTVSVKNTGQRAGDEVVMAYFQADSGVIPAGEPAQKLRKQLFDFTRVHVEVGQTATATFEVSAASVMLHAASGDAVLWPGKYTLQFTNGDDETEIGTASVRASVH